MRVGRIKRKYDCFAGPIRPARGGTRHVSALDAWLKGLLPISRVIDAGTAWLGRKLAWLIMAAVVVSAANATIRKVFDTSSNSWLELQWILFGVVFLLCSPWTLLANEHIRIDIVNNLFPKPVRNWIDVVGHAVFLIPWCIVMIITAAPFFWRSAMLNEQSGNAGGLPQWPAKSLVLIGFAILLVQAFSELIKRLAVMRDLIPDPHESSVSALEAEVERTVEAIEKR
jgi:TRAP-type mannitol/chloroaromatic compound transport system permease small subunit